MEIEDGGAVKVYDGPAMTNDLGSTPISGHQIRRQGSGVRAGATVGLIADAAEASALSPDLVAAVAWRESGFRPRLVSRAGAVGEMQLMPRTARALGVDPTDSRQNVRGGAAYLSSLMLRYKGDLVRTLAAYNAGPGAVDRYGGVPPFKETQAYVAAIMDRLSQVAVDPGLSGAAR